MAITQSMCTSFKVEVLGGIHDLDTDVIKVALYLSSATLGAGTTAYTTSGETTGSGYTAGGNTLTGAVISFGGTTAFASFSQTIFTGASFTTRGALIYNSSKANRAIAVLDFGGDQVVSSGDFVIVFPTADATDAIIRIA